MSCGVFAIINVYENGVNAHFRYFFRKFSGRVVALEAYACSIATKMATGPKRFGRTFELVIGNHRFDLTKRNGIDLWDVAPLRVVCRFLRSGTTERNAPTAEEEQ